MRVVGECCEKLANTYRCLERNFEAVMSGNLEISQGMTLDKYFETMRLSTFIGYEPSKAHPLSGFSTIRVQPSFKQYLGDYSQTIYKRDMTLLYVGNYIDGYDTTISQQQIDIDKQIAKATIVKFHSLKGQGLGYLFLDDRHDYMFKDWLTEQYFNDSKLLYRFELNCSYEYDRDFKSHRYLVVLPAEEAVKFLKFSIRRYDRFKEYYGVNMAPTQLKVPRIRTEFSNVSSVEELVRIVCRINRSSHGMCIGVEVANRKFNKQNSRLLRILQAWRRRYNINDKLTLYSVENGEKSRLPSLELDDEIIEVKLSDDTVCKLICISQNNTPDIPSRKAYHRNLLWFESLLANLKTTDIAQFILTKKDC